MNKVDLRIRTKVVHSQSKSAWNVISTMAGMKNKIARVPYLVGIWAMWKTILRRL